jgi:uncharacterized protein (DUF433 family)
MTSIDIKAIPPPLHFDANGVCRVSDTRVTLLTLIEAFLEGVTPEEIYQDYPSVPSVGLAEVYAVVAFYLGHRDEIDAYLDTVREREAHVIEEIKLRSPLSEIRRRLLRERRSLRDLVPRRRESKAQDHQRLVTPKPVRGCNSRTGCRVDGRRR